MRGMNKDLVRCLCCRVREHLDLTQDQMAVRFGVDRHSIYDWESGKYLPKSARLLLYVALAPLALRAEFFAAIQVEALDAEPALVSVS